MVAKSKEELFEGEGAGLITRLCDSPITSSAGLTPLFVRIHMRKDAAKVVLVNGKILFLYSIFFFNVYF